MSTQHQTIMTQTSSSRNETVDIDSMMEAGSTRMILHDNASTHTHTCDDVPLTNSQILQQSNLRPTAKTYVMIREQSIEIEEILDQNNDNDESNIESTDDDDDYQMIDKDEAALLHFESSQHYLKLYEHGAVEQVEDIETFDDDDETVESNNGSYILNDDETISNLTLIEFVDGSIAHQSRLISYVTDVMINSQTETPHGPRTNLRLTKVIEDVNENELPQFTSMHFPRLVEHHDIKQINESPSINDANDSIIQSNIITVLNNEHDNLRIDTVSNANSDEDSEVPVSALSDNQNEISIESCLTKVESARRTVVEHEESSDDKPLINFSGMIPTGDYDREENDDVTTSNAEDETSLPADHSNNDHAPTLTALLHSSPVVSKFDDENIETIHATTHMASPIQASAMTNERRSSEVFTGSSYDELNAKINSKSFSFN